MHNKLAGSKEFGRMVKIHNYPHTTPCPQNLHSLTLHKQEGIHTKPKTKEKKRKKKKNSNMDSLVNTTCFYKVTESANN